MNEWLYWKPAVLKEERMLFHISRMSVFFVNCEKWVPINNTLVWKARQPPMSPKGRVFLFYRNSHSAAHQGRSLQTWEHYETLIRFCLLGLLMLVPRNFFSTSYQKIPLTLLFVCRCWSLLYVTKAGFFFQRLSLYPACMFAFVMSRNLLVSRFLPNKVESMIVCSRNHAAKKPNSFSGALEKKKAEVFLLP